VVRNVYAHVLDARRVGELVADLPPTLARTSLSAIVDPHFR